MVILGAVLLVVVLLGVGFALGGRAEGPYPDRIDYGPITIRFTRVDRISYLVASLSLVVGAASGIALIWAPGEDDLIGRVLGTAAVLFVAALFLLLLNRIVRGRSAS